MKHLMVVALLWVTISNICNVIEVQSHTTYIQHIQCFKYAKQCNVQIFSFTLTCKAFLVEVTKLIYPQII